MRTWGKCRKVRQLVQPVDLMPTILDTMGIPAPDEWHGEGVSLAPFLQGETVRTRGAAFSGQPPVSPNPNTPGGHLRVSTREWALIYPPDIGGKREAPLLFNVKDDPGEEHNVIEEHPDIADALYRKYCKFFTAYNRAGEPVPLPPPDELL